MKNWTIKEAVEAINKNDVDAIKEISKHFPMFFLAVARNDLQGLTAMMPEKFTVRRLVMTDAANDAADTVDGDIDAADVNDADLSSMSTKELMKLCDKRGIKVPHYGKNKQFYLDALNGAGGNDEATEDAEAEDNDNPYDGKSAMELYKECKKRGIKCEPKKKSTYYAELLVKDDEQNAADDDEWDNNEAEENTKANKKSGKQAAAADDDDDWDI